MSVADIVWPATSVLSPREKDVLTLVAGGASNQEISHLLDTEQATVRSHLKNMRRKLGVARPEGLLLAAVGLDSDAATSENRRHEP